MEIVRLSSETYPKELQEAWKTAYGEDFVFKYPGRFEWLHLKNPYSSLDTLCVLYIYVDGNIAAWTTAIPHKIKVGNKVVHGGFGADTFTLAEYRRLGLGLKLIDKVNNQFDIYWSISMSASNRRNRKRLGYAVEGKPVKFYLKVIRSIDKESFLQSVKDIVKDKNKILRLISGNRISAWLSYFLVNTILKSHQKEKSNQFFEFKEIEFFDQETDNIWTTYSSDIDFATNRNSEYLNWRYGNQPFTSYKKFKVLFQGKVIGFFVFRICSEIQRFECCINELIVIENKENAVPAILDFINITAKENKGSVIYIASSEDSINNIIELAGYNCYDSYEPLCIINPIIKDSLEIDKVLTKQSKWMISFGDQDLDQVNKQIKQPDSFLLFKLCKHIMISKFKRIKSKKT
jgi:hypothetical protein